jgi:hypothetical protein
MNIRAIVATMTPSEAISFVQTRINALNSDIADLGVAGDDAARLAELHQILAELQPPEPVRTIKIEIYCADRFSFELREGDRLLAEGEQTYVPEWFPGGKMGDEFKLVIDLATGRIMNWVAPAAEVVQATIDEYGEDLE